MTQIAQLVKMANQIALNFSAAAAEDEAMEQTVEHLRRYWTPAMTRRLLDYIDQGGEGCAPLVQRLVREHL